LLILLITISFLPFIFVYIDMVRGKTDIFVSKREERRKYYILTLFSYIMGVLSLNLIGISAYNILFYAYFIVGLMLFIQNIKYKISIHAAGIAGPTTLLVAEYDSFYWLLYLVLIPVIWSRLKMKAHSKYQIISGALTSVIMTYILVLVLKA